MGTGGEEENKNSGISDSFQVLEIPLCATLLFASEISIVGSPILLLSLHKSHSENCYLYTSLSHCQNKDCFAQFYR